LSQFAIVRMRDGEELVCRIQTELGAETPYLLCAPVVRARDGVRPYQHCTFRWTSRAKVT
jgi:toxin CcdB